MKKFCPSCDTLVETEASDQPRCPNCHKSLASQGEPVLVDQTVTRSSRWLVAGAAVAVVAAAGAGLWYTRGTATTKGETGPAPLAAAAAAGAVAAKMAAAGLSAELAQPPGLADETARKFATGLTSADDLAARLLAMAAPGGLQPLPPQLPRKHPVLESSALFASVQTGKALPVHSLEVAFMVKALFEARGDKATLVLEASGLQTPLLLTRTRVAVQLASGKLVEPLSKLPMVKPQALSETQAVAWWLVVRANSARVSGEFKAANLDLAAAEALAPGLSAVKFAKGIMQLEQKLEEQGLATCEAALAGAADPLAHLFLTEAMLSNEQPVKALQHCDDALKIAPGLPEALVAKAVVLLRRVASVPAAQRDTVLGEASALLEEALKTPSPPPGARAAKAQMLLLKKEMQAAENHLRAAVKDHRDLESALMLSAMLREKGSFEEAAQLVLSMSSSLDDERVVMAAVQAYIGAKQVDKALELAEKAFVANRGNPTIGLMRADLLRQNGKIKESIAALEPLKAGTDGERISLLQAQLYIQDGQFAQALKLIEGLRAKKPADREPAMLHLVALAMGEQRDQADKVAAQAIVDKVLKPMEVVELWLQANDLERAKKLLEQAVDVPKPDPELAATLAALYTATGSKDKAIALRDKVAATMGDRGEEYKKSVDQGIAAADAEVKAMHDAAAKPGAAGPADAPGPSGDGGQGGRP